MVSVPEAVASFQAVTKALYEAFPYPSGTASGTIADVANLAAFLFPSDTLAGKRVLDAGCGSGQRLVALAKRFPAAEFVGVDLAEAPLEVARTLARNHGVANIRFEQMNLAELRWPDRFDLIFCTGVIHHLPNPQAGVMKLAEHLAPGGRMVLWLYHALGEFYRLLDRELVLTMLDDPQDGLALLRDLGISVARDRYSGAYAKRDNDALDQDSIDADAYLNPIVHAYRFGEAFKLLRDSGMKWAAIHSIAIGSETKLLDLGQKAKTAQGLFCVRPAQLFDSPEARERFARLTKSERLRVIELRMRPNGFVILAGLQGSLEGFDERIQGNAITLRG